MNALIRLTLALAAGAVVSPSFAQSLPHLSAETATLRAVKIPQIQARIAGVQRGTSQPAATDGTGLVNPTPLPGPRRPNEFRAYPPSCAADPLPDVTTAPLYSAPVNLFATNSQGDHLVETVTVTIWRLPCSSSGNTTPYNSDGGTNAITLMRIDRSDTNNRHTDYYPTFPLLYTDQGTFVGNLVRAAPEPNTVVADAGFGTPIFVSTTYVLENYPTIQAGMTEYNLAFNLYVDPATTDDQVVQISVPNYPNRTDLPPLPIDGYMSSVWYDSAHSGEGMLTQIYNNPDNTSRTLFAAWYTYDANGIPFWLAAQGTAAVGSNTFSNVPVYYYTGGGFAGNFNGVTQHTWGTMNFSFPNCSQVDFDYNGATTDVAGGPGGQGSRSFKKIADINGLNCE